MTKETNDVTSDAREFLAWWNSFHNTEENTHPDLGSPTTVIEELLQEIKKLKGE